MSIDIKFLKTGGPVTIQGQEYFLDRIIKRNPNQGRPDDCLEVYDSKINRLVLFKWSEIKYKIFQKLN